VTGNRSAWLGLGSNLGDPVRRISEAVCRLASSPGVVRLRASRLWRGAYVGPLGPQPDYYNICARIDTWLSPRELLELGLGLEREAGRRTPTHQAPRVLDIDLLLFDTLCLEEPGLTLPHPRMRERRFVLEPLAELDPDLGLVPDGVRVADLLRQPGIRAQELEVVSLRGGTGMSGSGE
jgi:2-amino-4-hydroxy-6-hydroxymethyldihydropteridine diphosphokinase